MIYGIGQNRRSLAVPWLSVQQNGLVLLVYLVVINPTLIHGLLLLAANIVWLAVLLYVINDTSSLQDQLRDSYPPII